MPEEELEAGDLDQEEEDQEDQEEAEDQEGEDKGDIDEEESEEEPNDIQARVSELEASLKEKSTHISDLNSALYGYRKEIKSLKSKPAEEEPGFTDAQITSILEEHKDDPAVMLQVFKQVAKQQTAGIKEDAVDATEISRTKQNIDGFLYNTWPQLKEEGSNEFNQLQEAKSFMRIADHPYGDFLSMGAVMLQKLPELISNAREEGKAAALKDKSEVVRKGNVKKTKLSPGKRSAASKVVVTDEIKATANAIGITGEKQIALYAKLLGNKGQSMTVED